MQLYDKYGGLAAISEIVHAFYDKVVASPSLDPYFGGVEMAALIEHQTRFLCKVLGGPDNVTGLAMGKAHQPHAITAEAFVEVTGLLKEVLEEAHVDPADVTLILGVVASVRSDVVKAA